MSFKSILKPALWLFSLFALLCASTVFADTITVQHYKGTLTLPQTPKRVVVIGQASLDVVDALGVEPVGVVKSLLPSYLAKFSAEKYQAIGNPMEPDFEAIYSLKPDLIIAENRLEPVYDKLAAIAPTYMFYTRNGHYWEDTQQNWKNLATIFGKQNQLDTIVKSINARIDAIHQKNKTAPESLLMVMNNGSNLAGFGADSRYSFLFDELGFKLAESKNVPVKAGRHGNVISFEYIADAKPDAILVIDREQAIGKGEGKAKSLFDNKLIASTPAAQNKHLVFVNSTAWYLATGGIHATEMMLDDAAKALN